MQQSSTMPTIAVMFGIILFALGVVAFNHPGKFGFGKHHVLPNGKPIYDPAIPGAPTSLIPAVLGIILIGSGALAMAKPETRKHAMHAAAAAGLLGAVGGLVPVMLRNGDTHEAAVKVGYILTVTSMIFVALCINSFVQARAARKAGETAATAPPTM